MTTPKISIIIRCYNEAEHIGKLLHGISEQTTNDYEIVLVDSGSTDGTLETAKEFGVNKIEYIDPGEFSFGRALNKGIEAASGKICVIASAHVYPKKEDWLETLVATFEEDIALVYGKQRGNDVTSFSENRIFEQWFPEQDIERQDTPFCNNANAAIRREIWQKYPYDEQLTGLEDVDWAKRVQEAGYDISYASDAEIIHVHDETFSEVVNRYRRESYAHKQIIPEQEFTFSDFVTITLANIISDYKYAYKENEILPNLFEIVKFRVAQFYGTYRGFTESGPVSHKLWQRFYYPNSDGYPGSNEDKQKNGNVEDTVQKEIEYSNYTESSPSSSKSVR